MPRDVRDQCAGFRARPRFTPGFRGFSAYTTCMVGIEHLSGDRKCWTKISDFFYSAIILVSDGFSLSPVFEKHSGLTTNVRSQK
ncbi:hypothetical protein F2Q70_00025776 [Brassica cretica]|uniref:Uncharacterized protein n=1 Tax=Brassica cretica TaxID=69181 RepID=A0A8S9LG50_BRACR|nr:hypothetical protein F2Q70_00025776 [Brassica cretica]